MNNTAQQYDNIIEICRDLFLKKMSDYGSAWRILRLPSLTNEFIGIINYSLMALVQIELGIAAQPDLSTEVASFHYDQKVADCKELMENKNHDYGEAWREMRVSSLTDLILQKLLRVKQIEDNKGETLVSEGIQANYQDIVNYAVFALILLDFKK